MLPNKKKVCVLQKISSPEMISEFNKHLILDALRFKGPMSRADLSRYLNISFPAVSSNARGLLDAGYIMEVGTGDNLIGRKSTLLAFNANRGYIIGVDEGRFRIRMMLTDLLGNELARIEIMNPIRNSDKGTETIRLLEAQLHVLLKQADKQANDILCIVIGVPGVFKDGEIYLAPFTEKYTEQDLRDTLKRSFKADVILQNCVNLGVIGEQWKGKGTNFQNIAYISYGVGLGSAHIVDGKLFSGPNGAVGEIGFMVTDRTTIRDQFDEVGPLEEALSRNKIDKYLQGGNFDEEIVKLIQNYQIGELYAKAIVDEIALNFGIALVNMCALLNPEVVIISGGLGVNLGKLFLDQWKAFLQNHIPFAPEVRISELNHTETMLGAVMTGIDHIHAMK